VVVRADPEREWRVGQVLSLGAPQGRVHVFGEDGKRLRPVMQHVIPAEAGIQVSRV
jgi:hypothetical protein